MIVPVILSGGAGTRLWPLSRGKKPKQFQALVGNQSMLARTAARMESIAGLAQPLVVCNESHADLVRREVPGARILTEPAGRNTAPAIAAAAIQLEADDIMVVLPSDHLILDEERFADAIETAVKGARDGWLVTFGVVPTHPATGYGYIQPGVEVAPGTQRIDQFSEKPDAATAQTYLDNGYLWNSGMFVMAAGQYLAELQSHRPDIAEAVATAVDSGEIHPLEWESCPSASIDYAVMEETNRAAVVPLDAGWSDVGSWRSLLELGDADEHGNVVSGKVIVSDTTGSYVRAGSRLVAVAGLEDVIVVETEDAVLVLARDAAEKVKDIIEQLPEDLR